jgi:hypothetical protein
MSCAPDMAITRRFLGFVSEVIGFRPISRTLRVLVVRPAHPSPHAGCELAAVFFAPGVKGIAIALWATNRPSGTTMPRTLLRAFESSAKKFREVTAPEEIHGALTALYSALEAQLRGKPEFALMLTSAFAGAAFNLAATAAASAGMPPTGNSSLANYLAMFPTERPKPANDEIIEVSDSDTSVTAELELLQAQAQDSPGSRPSPVRVGASQKH